MKTYTFKISYYVIDEDTNETLATTENQKVADFLAENYPANAVVRVAQVKTVVYR